MKVDARLKIIYLFLIAILCFIVNNVIVISLIGLFQVALLLYNNLSLKELSKSVRKVLLFFFFILLSYTFMYKGNDCRVIEFFGISLKISLDGFISGFIMCVRILIISLASQLTRKKGREAEFLNGLKSLKVPEFIALAIDGSFAMLGSKGEKGRNKEFKIKRLLKPDISILVNIIINNLNKAREYVKDKDLKLEKNKLKDLGVILGIAGIMISIKLIKILPGLPIAPGHKGIILIPLFIVSNQLTHTNKGATLCGITTGAVSFLCGFGKYGIFDIFKHIIPGVVVDVFMPVAKRCFTSLSIFICSLAGLIAAAARFSTIIIITLLMRPPAGFYALLAPIFFVHCVFGLLSGFITYYLLKSLNKFEEEDFYG